MGCGSGILSIAAAKIWSAARIMAVDIDPIAVKTTLENAVASGVGKRVTSGAGNGYAALKGRSGGSYDLILSNILARPLCKMAPSLNRALKPGGAAVLSGLLYHQTAAVLAAHRQQGLVLAGKWRFGDWMTLMLEKKTGACSGRAGRNERPGQGRRFRTGGISKPPIYSAREASWRGAGIKRLSYARPCWRLRS